MQATRSWQLLSSPPSAQLLLMCGKSSLGAVSSGGFVQMRTAQLSKQRPTTLLNHNNPAGPDGPDLPLCSTVFLDKWRAMLNEEKIAHSETFVLPARIESGLPASFLKPESSADARCARPPPLLCDARP